MSSFLREHPTFLGLLGTGLFTGIGGVVIYIKINSVFRQLFRLSNSIAELRNEVLELKQKVESTRPRRRFKGYYSVQTSSGDEDTDAYEDAYDDRPETSTTTSDSYQDVLTEPEDQGNSTTTGQDSKTDNLFEEVDRLVNGSDEDKIKAYNLLENNRSKYLTDVEYYWRLSKSTYQVGQIEGSRGNADKKKELLYEAKDIAEKAVKLDETSSNSHKWFSITLGSVGDYEGTQQKIQNGYVFKQHIERAIELNPKDPSNHHLLGRWCYGVYMLSWIERKAAGALYATPPSSTADEALEHFQQAETLNPGKWKENMLYIAKCYIEVRSYKEAALWLEKADKLPVVSQDDKTSQTEIESLLAKYGTYA